MAFRSGGDPIVQPVEVNIPEELCFFSDCSYDPDGYTVQHVWDIPVKPEGSTIGSTMYYTNEPHHGICLTFDKVGDYEITLKVQDNDGAWSDTKRVHVEGLGRPWLMMVLTFDGCANENSLIDMDLQLIDPSGSILCSDNTMNINNACVFPNGNGMATMGIHTDGGGTVEEMRLIEPRAGIWTVRAAYMESCCDHMPAPTPVCMGNLRNNPYTLKFYDPNFPDVLLKSYSGTLDDIGDIESYQLALTDNGWVFP